LKKFSLILSGGGALGISQLGIVKQLEKDNLFPSEVIGTSMGALIAACLSIGLNSNDILDLFKKFSKITNWIKFSFGGNSIIDNDKIKNILISIFDDKKMHETIIPLKIIATALNTGNKRVFSAIDTNISIVDALLSSIAIPGVFEATTIDDIVYVDGFLCENLGLTESSFDDIIAVDVLGYNSYNPDLPSSSKLFNILDMFEKSMRLLIYNQRKSKLDSLFQKNPNVNLTLIDVKTDAYKTFHFHAYLELASLWSNDINFKEKLT
jgi:NTE family protein